MIRGDDIVVTYGDTEVKRWTVTGESLEVRDVPGDEPVNLLGKRARWRVYPSPTGDVLFDLSTESDPAKLTIEDAEAGVVRLDLTAEETSVDPWNGRYYLTIEDGGDQWTAYTGSYVVVE